MQDPATGVAFSQRSTWWFRRLIVFVLAAFLLADKQSSSTLKGGIWDGDTSFTLDVEPNQPDITELQERFNGAVAREYKDLREFTSPTRNFVFRSNEADFVLFVNDQDRTYDETVRAMSRCGLRPALYQELLAFAQRFPRRFSAVDGDVVELGSFAGIKGHILDTTSPSYNAALSYRGEELSLELRPFIRVVHWPASTRYLAVRLPPQNLSDAR